MRIPHRHRFREQLDVEMTPMIDVVFLLLIYFIWTITFQDAVYDAEANVMVIQGASEQKQSEPTDEPPPEQPPTLKAMVRMVAQLGGYVNRKRDDDPGPQTLWLGLQRTHDMALCWQTFGPEAKSENILV